MLSNVPPLMDKESVMPELLIDGLTTPFSVAQVLQEPPSQEYPTIMELRRLVGFTAALSKYQSSTNIVTQLSTEPYHIPQRIIDGLIRIADIASIGQQQSDEEQGIHLDTHVASDLIQLANDLYSCTAHLR
jgi:hypothetical protein